MQQRSWITIFINLPTMNQGEKLPDGGGRSPGAVVVPLLTNFQNIGLESVLEISSQKL